MSKIAPFDPHSDKPGMYDNRTVQFECPPGVVYNYLVVGFDGVLRAASTQRQAKELWSEQQRHKDRLTKPPAARKPLKREGVPEAKAGANKHKRSKANAEKLDRDRRKQKRRNPKLAAAPRDAAKRLARQRKAAPKVGSRNKKWVCSKCGQIIRVSCLRYSPGTIVHREKWNKEQEKFVPCKGIFYPVE